MAALPIFQGLYSGTSAMENEHNDSGGHMVWANGEGGLVVEFVKTSVGRAKNCPECGTRRERTAPVTTHKSARCYRPVSVAGEACHNCGEAVRKTPANWRNKSPFSHRGNWKGE